MNIVTFNDQFHEIQREVTMAGTHPFPKGWEQSPLFQYEIDFQRERRLLENAPDTTVFRLPFPMLRLSVVERDTETEGRKGAYRAEYVVDGTDPDRINVMIVVKELFFDDPLMYRHHLSKRDLPLAFQIYDLCWNDRDSESSVLYKSVFRFHQHWIGERTSFPAESRAVLDAMQKHYANGAVDSLAVFALDCMSPGLHVVQVCPDRPGRTVHWTQSRTHYTLITHGHPANRKEVQQGATVVADRKEELTRMAHARRAHYRTLSHERFRFARGKTVLVKASWIGPKEWKDAGTRQIYKILEPVERNGDLILNSK